MIGDVPPQGSASLFLPPGSMLEFQGQSIIIGAMDLQIRSEGEGATLDAQHLSQVFVLQRGARLHLHKMTLLNGFASVNGGAVLLTSNASIVLTSCNLTNSIAENLGGTMGVVSGSSVTMVACGIGNSTAREGGALMISDSIVLMSSCLIVNSNVETNGGVFYVSASTGSLTATGCTITNSSAYNGGVMYLHNPDRQ